MEAELTVPYPEHVSDAVDTFTRSIALALSQQPPTVFCFLGQSADAAMPDAWLLYEIQVRQLGEPQKMAFVHYTYVAPPARGLGMATKLATLAAEHMAAQGLTHVELTTRPDLGALWADLGFLCYEHRYHAPLARAQVGLEERGRRHNALAGNGIDREVSDA